MAKNEAEMKSKQFENGSDSGSDVQIEDAQTDGNHGIEDRDGNAPGNDGQDEWTFKDVMQEVIANNTSTGARRPFATENGQSGPANKKVRQGHAPASEECAIMITLFDGGSSFRKFGNELGWNALACLVAEKEQ